MEITYYAGEETKFRYNVTYVVRKTGEVLVKSFDSPYLANKFANKIRHSKRCALLTSPVTS